MATAHSFLTYEETVPLITSSIFKSFTIYSKEETEAVIESLPDVPYGEMPPGLSSSVAEESKTSEEHPLSTKEKNGQNSFARALCMRDNRKASGIAAFVKKVINKDIDCSPQNPSNRNCCYGAVLQQISNHDYNFNQKTGEEYSDDDFRLQTLFHMAENAEKVYTLVKLHLDVPYKTWLRQQLSNKQDGDMASLIGMRHMLNVSTSY